MRLLYIGLVSLIALFLLSAGNTNVAQAAYPEKPVSVLVGYAPGGGQDIVGRMFSELLSKELGQKFVVVNLPGAGGSISFNQAVTDKPDGYTLVFTNSTISTAKALGLSKYTYRDLQQIAAVHYDFPALMVRSDSPYKTLEDFIADAKANPGKITVGTSAPGATWHQTLLRFAKKADIDIVSIPNSQGTAGVTARILGKHVDAGFIALNEALSQINNKDFRLLAFPTKERDKYFPEVPTLLENNIDMSVMMLRGFQIPKGAPKEVIDTLEAAMRKVSESKEWNDWLTQSYGGPIFLDRVQFEEYLAKEEVDFTNLVREAGLIN